MNIPAFHPELLVTFWLTTPGINKLDPHLVSFLLLGIIVVIFVVKLRKRKAAVVQVDPDEQRFQRLIKEKGIIERKLVNLEQDSGGLTVEQYKKKKNELEKHLQNTTKELQHYI